MNTAPMGGETTARGRLIVLEGIEGAGKTTQMGAIVAWLSGRGYDVVATREPGGTPLGERIRDLLLAVPDTPPKPIPDQVAARPSLAEPALPSPLSSIPSSSPRPSAASPSASASTSGVSPGRDRGAASLPAMCPETELLLMFAARAEHWRRVIAPALAAGRVVVSDRFVDASYAYQGGGRGLGAGRVRVLEEWLLGDARADLVLWFDVPPAVGLSRARRREADQGSRHDRFEREAIAFFERARAAYAERASASPERYRRIDAAQPPEAVRAAVVAALEGAVSVWSGVGDGTVSGGVR